MINCAIYYIYIYIYTIYVWQLHLGSLHGPRCRHSLYANLASTRTRLFAHSWMLYFTVILIYDYFMRVRSRPESPRVESPRSRVDSTLKSDHIIIIKAETIVLSVWFMFLVNCFIYELCSPGFHCSSRPALANSTNFALGSQVTIELDLCESEREREGASIMRVSSLHSEQKA